ncbi:MAG: hypothetical protein ACREL5_14545 [Gemmatimonadales bacterium]
MPKTNRWLWGTYFAVALYLGSTLKTGDLVIRFGVAVLLFFVVPAPFYFAAHRAKRAAKG